MEGTISNGVLTIQIPLTEGELSKSGKTLVCHNDNKFQPIDGTDYSVKVIVVRKLEGNLAHLIQS